MRNISEIQERLVLKGYLPKLNERGEKNIDGKFGERSLDAYNHYRATLGKGPVVQASMAELNADLFPEEQTVPVPKPPNPLQNWLLGLAINQIASKLKDSNMSFLLGTKTAITGVVMIVVGAASLLAPIIGLGSVPGLTLLSPGEAMAVIGNGFGLIFLRGAVAKIG